MPFADVEISEHDAEQTFLYRVVGVNFDFSYTNAQRSVFATVGGIEYEFKRPRGGITHTELVSNANEPERSRVTLSVSIGNPIVRKHNQYPPHGNTTLVIYRQNEIDGTPRQEWSGTLFSPQIEGIEAHFECLTDEELMKRSEGLNDTFQSLCNWFFGIHPCPVNIENWRVPVTVESIDTENFTVTVSGASGNADDWFKPGLFVASNGDKRTIIDDSVSGSNHTFTLQQNFPSTTLKVGDLADAYPVCDRSYTQGSVKFGSETGSGAGCGTNNIQTNVSIHEIGRLQ